MLFFEVLQPYLLRHTSLPPFIQRHHQQLRNHNKRFDVQSLKMERETILKHNRLFIRIIGLCWVNS